MADTLVSLGASTAQRSDATFGQDLVRLVAHGDRAAFASLYDLLGGAIFARCLCLTGDYGRAETVCRETLVEMWRTAARFDSRRSTVVAWAFGIADRRGAR